ncbi:MAG TPA: helix-turn-helix domain-containing protein [Streptosporangiaceae bacterium]|nr:helix-turn-helix domain-containing protein [Streptosporangiaceae bacterium]
MSPRTSTKLTRAIAESIRQQLGTDTVVLITPGEFTRAVVVAPKQNNDLHAAETLPESALESRDTSVPSGGRLAYSVPEVAQVLGLSRDVIYDEIRSGRLESLKVGRRRIITRKQVDEFLTRLSR